MSELAIRYGDGLQIRNMDDLSRMSKMLASSGYFSDAKDAAQCGVKVIAGLSMGIDPFAAMTGIHIIKGKPSIGAGLMASAVKRHPKYNYRVLEMSTKVCRIKFFEDGEECGISEFTAVEAKAAGTQNMQKFAKNMLFARAISNGVKWYCPDVFDMPTYTPEELGASVDGEGNIIDVQPEAELTPKQRLSKAFHESPISVEDVQIIANQIGLPSESKYYTHEQVDLLIQAMQAKVDSVVEERYEQVMSEEITELESDMEIKQ